MLKGKIHRATVTGADLQYEGSVTLDPVLMEASDLLPFEQVQLLDIDNGARLTTYAIEGRRGSGDVIVNGAAAHLIHRGDTIIILHYATVSEEEAQRMQPSLVYVNERNEIARTGHSIDTAAQVAAVAPAALVAAVDQ
jgi:aspartate 1-decarboxylase